MFLSIKNVEKSVDSSWFSLLSSVLFKKGIYVFIFTDFSVLGGCCALSPSQMQVQKWTEMCDSCSFSVWKVFFSFFLKRHKFWYFGQKKWKIGLFSGFATMVQTARPTGPQSQSSPPPCSFGVPLSASYEGGVSGGIPSSLGVAVSSLGSRLSFRLTVLSERGGVDSEWGGVSSEEGGINSVRGDTSREGFWIPLAVGGGLGSIIGVAGTGSERATTGSARRGAELVTGLSVSDREAFPTKRHCMMLVSLPPVEMRWLSL